MAGIKILIIVTSRDHMVGNHNKTGIWLEELAIPYYVFTNGGASVKLASTKGGIVPVDPKSESIIVSNSTIKRFQKDPVAQLMMSNSEPISMQQAADFDLVFLAGGHGAMWDFCNNIFLKQLLEDFNWNHKPIGAVSHGVSAFLPMEKSSSKPFVEGRMLTSFSNTEEKAYGLTVAVPFLLETELISLGASYSKKANFENHTVTDQNIITGQNASSVREVADKLLLSLKVHTKIIEAVDKPLANSKY
jgi:putative intracellular protease/amidase